MSEDHVSLTIPREFSKARAIRHVISELDGWDTIRSVQSLPDDRSEVDEDKHLQTEPSIGTGTDESDVDSERSEPGDIGDGDAQIVEVRESTDAGITGTSDNMAVETGSTDELEAPVERTEPESDQGERKRGLIAFHFAPGQHSRGN